MRTAVISLFLVLAAAVSAAGQGVLSGTVKDESGGVVAGASVTARTASGVVRRTVTGSEGQFSIETPADPAATLVIRAGGFAEATVPITGTGNVEVVLKPASVLDSVTVTPDRTE